MAKKKDDLPKSGPVNGKITTGILKNPGKASIENVDRGTATDADRQGRTPDAVGELPPDGWAPGDRFRAARGA